MRNQGVSDPQLERAGVIPNHADGLIDGQTGQPGQGGGEQCLSHRHAAAQPAERESERNQPNHALRKYTGPIHHDGRELFAGLPNPFQATRYHSLVVERASFPTCLEITAWVEEGEIMGLRHRELPIWGVQFHPESILTEGGMDILRNFLEMTR